MICLDELGVWLASKVFNYYHQFCFNSPSQWVDIIGFASEKQAAWSFSRKETDHYSWEKLDVKGETIVRNFSFDAYKTFASFLPSGMSIVLDFS